MIENQRSIGRFRVVTLLVVAGTVAIAASGFAQTPYTHPGQPAAAGLVGLNLIGPVFGVYSGSLELSLDDEWSVFVVPTYFNVKASLIGVLIESAGVDRDDYNLWSLSGAVGLNYFLADPAPLGFFVGAWVEPGYLQGRFEHSAVAESEPVTVDTIVVGAGAHVGYRVLLGPVAITPRVGAAYHHVFTEAKGVDEDLKTTVSAAFSRFSIPWGIDLTIAF